MFWAQILKSGKKCPVVIKKPLHISKAALDLSSGDSSLEDIQSVVCHSGGEKFILCHLSTLRNLQESLDLMFAAGSKIVFECTGKSSVHLTGYLLEEKNVSISSAEDLDESVRVFEDPVESWSSKLGKKLPFDTTFQVTAKGLVPASLQDLKSDTDSDSEDADYNYNADLLKEKLKVVKRQTKTFGRQTFTVKGGADSEDTDFEYLCNSKAEPKVKGMKRNNISRRTVKAERK